MVELNNHYNCSICDNDFRNANISYTRLSEDHACIYIGGDTDSDSTHQTWIHGNTIAGTYHSYALDCFGNDENVFCGINNMTPGRSGLVNNWSATAYGDLAMLYVDRSTASSYANFGDVVIRPKEYFGKVTGQRTRIVGNIEISDYLTLYDKKLVLNMATGTLTEAQLEALHTTPITVIAAPGSGKAIVVVGAQFFYDYNSAAYGVDAGDDLVLNYTDGAGATILQVETTGFLSATSDQMRYATPTTTAEFNPVANAAVVAYLSGALTSAGNSPVKYRIEYKVVDASW
jgi:hypothetical protein